MDSIEEIIILRKQINELQSRIAALEQIPITPFDLFKSNTCKKCGIKLNQVMGYVCPNSSCPVGMGPSTCSSMTSEPCHDLTLGGFNLEVGPDYKDSNIIGELNGIIAAFDSKSQVSRDERDKYNKGMDELSRYWRDNPDKAPKY